MDGLDLHALGTRFKMAWTCMRFKKTARASRHGLDCSKLARASMRVKTCTPFILVLHMTCTAHRTRPGAERAYTKGLHQIAYTSHYTSAQMPQPQKKECGESGTWKDGAQMVGACLGVALGHQSALAFWHSRMERGGGKGEGHSNQHFYAIMLHNQFSKVSDSDSL